MKQRITLLTLLLIALTGLSSAQIVFDDSSNVEFDTGLDLTGQSITGYYNGACPDGEAVTDIQDDGTLVCESISTGTTQGLPSVLTENNRADQNINLDGNTLTGLPAPNNADEPVNLEYLESQYEASGSQNLSQVLENGNVANQSIDLSSNNITNVQALESFFSSACSSGEAVTAIQDDGTVVCEGVSGSASGLSEVLEVNNTANQSIDLEGFVIKNSNGGIEIGDASTETYDDRELVNPAIAIGKGAVTRGAGAVGQPAADIAIGSNAESDGSDPASALSVGSGADALANNAIGLGTRAAATGSNSVAVGTDNSASGSRSIAIGRQTSATAKGAVAIGSDAVASNEYEATFGNLNGQELDLNVTGNATVHQNADVQGDLNVGGELTGVSTGGAPKNLSETLAAGNVANQSINLDENNLNFVRRIGIGTGSPDSDLEIEGSNTETRLSYESGGYGEIQFENSGDILWGSGSLGGSYGNGNSGSYYIYQYEDLDGNNVDAYRLYIDETGNVGIGTDSPSAQLDVDGEVDLSSNNITNVQALESFFSSACSSGEAVTAIQDDGTVVCEEVSGGGSTSGLSEVLEANNTANQSINAGGNNVDSISELTFDKGVNIEGSIFQGGIGEMDKVVAVGGSANRASSTAVGWGSGIGDVAASAFGESASAFGFGSTALGQDSDATGQGSVAIGFQANAPNEFEATFGNLDNDPLSLNVTGNATVHQDADVQGDLNVGGELTGVSTGGSAENLSETLAAGNVANQSIKFDSSISLGPSSSSTEIPIGIGYGTTADQYDSIALGDYTQAESSAISIGHYVGTGHDEGEYAIGIGYGSSLADGVEASGNHSIAFGSNTSAKSLGAVAIGRDAVSNQDYTARFGSDSRAYDVDVTGDLSVDGRVEETNVRDIGYSSGHTAWSSGLSNEEVNRFGTTSTESVEVERLDVQVKGGGTNSNFEVEAYDAGTGSVLGSTTAGTPINDVGTTSEGADLTIRVTNSDGSDVTATITVAGHVVE